MLMSNGGKRLNELIRRYGFRLGAVAEAIDVDSRTMRRWTDNAPIGKLIKLCDFTHIPMDEVIECFRNQANDIDPTRPNQIDRTQAVQIDPKLTGGEHN
jgi:hypothetical protein